LSLYSGIPHLGRPVITDVHTAATTLSQTCAVMDNRYTSMHKSGLPFEQTGMPRIIVVIDELADLMLQARQSVEPSIVRIAQMGRAAGIHLIIATQRPTVNVVTGLIKANISARIALTMASHRDSSVIEIPNAHKLAGKGDALYQPPDHTIQPIRFQSAYTSREDVAAIVKK